MAKSKACQHENIFDESSFSDEVMATRDFLFNIKNPYVGNKKQIVGDIAIALHNRLGSINSFVDLFGGSSVVSIFFKLLNKRVTTNELLTSSYYNAVSFVENSDITLSKEEIVFLCENKTNNCDFILNRFKDRFTPEECCFLDNYRSNIDILFPDNLIKRALAFVSVEHYVMDKCFLGGRLNKGQILAELNHRLSHKRNNGDEMRGSELIYRFFPLPLFKGDGKAYNMDAETFLETIHPEADVLYADPPYGGSQSDYSNMFSFCEEYVYRKPLEELEHIKNANKYSSRKGYEEQFQSLLQKASYFKCLAISYNNSSWADIDTIKGIISQFKRNIEVIEIDHKYKYRDNKSEKPKAKEYLIIAQ